MHISANIIFENHHCICICISMINHIKYFVIRIFRGTCSSVRMLKGHMVRDRLGTPALNERSK